MRGIIWAGLLLTGCASAELTSEGARVQLVHQAPTEGCRLLGTVKEGEGGGLRTMEQNQGLVVARLRNEAARVGGDSVVVIASERGDTDSGMLQFQTGVPGLGTPSPRCTNCIELTARIYQCGGPAAGSPVVVDPGAGCHRPPAEPAE
jgi:hypothetical protein